MPGTPWTAVTLRTWNPLWNNCAKKDILFKHFRWHSSCEVLPHDAFSPPNYRCEFGRKLGLPLVMKLMVPTKNPSHIGYTFQCWCLLFTTWQNKFSASKLWSFFPESSVCMTVFPYFTYVCMHVLYSIREQDFKTRIFRHKVQVNDFLMWLVGCMLQNVSTGSI